MGQRGAHALQLVRSAACSSKPWREARSMKALIITFTFTLAGCVGRVVCSGELAPGVHVECTCVESCEQEDTEVEVMGKYCEPHCYAFLADGGTP